MCWQVDIQKVWLLFSSVVLAFAFIFGNSIRQLYEAVILLFVIHPYDVGDWLMIGQAQYQVRTLAVNVYAQSNIMGVHCSTCASHGGSVLLSAVHFHM